MKIVKTTRDRIVSNEYLFIKDKPSIFKSGGYYFSVHFDMSNSTGTFLRPAGMFNSPQVGDLIDTTMNSGKVLRSVVTLSRQDYDTCKGEIHILGYVEDYHKIIRHNRID